MMTVYAARSGKLTKIAHGHGVPDDVVWIDLLRPTVEEDRLVEAAVGAAVPTREEMVEIEPSSRLYVEGGGRYMTASVLCQSDEPDPTLSPITFILVGRVLVTVRYETPKSFDIYAARACGKGGPISSGETVLMGLFDAVIDRLADTLETVGGDVDELSRLIFLRVGAQAYRKPYKELLKRIGRQGDLTSKARESLVTMQRVLLYFGAEVEGAKSAKGTKAQLRPMQRDVSSLTEHASFLNDKITFLLDAMLGMVSLAQNDIVKLFSVMSVVFLPPTLVASIYGMNFEFMPELKWAYGYPYALGLMLLSAVIPYLFFKWRRWL